MIVIIRIIRIHFSTTGHYFCTTRHILLCLLFLGVSITWFLFKTTAGDNIENSIYSLMDLLSHSVIYLHSLEWGVIQYILAG